MKTDKANKKSTKAQTAGTPQNMLDEHDKTILRELQADGRLPYSKLAAIVGLSEAATRQRVNRLTERGVMQIVAVTDPTKMGFGYQAMVGICVQGDPKVVAAEIAKIDNADYVVITAGRYDMLVELFCRDADDLLDIIGTRVRATPGVLSTEIMSYLQLVKQTYDWGTN